jgi:hypothetical protein
MVAAGFSPAAGARRIMRQQHPQGFGWHYKAHRRGLDMGNIKLTTTDSQANNLLQYRLSMLMRYVLHFTFHEEL